MTTRPLLLILSLALSGCGTTSVAVAPSCPVIPPPPPEIMEPVEVDYLKRVKAWLYELDETAIR
jgi:hypothetical protein